MQAADIMAVGCLWLNTEELFSDCMVPYACSEHTTMCVCIKLEAKVFDESLLCVAGAWLICLLVQSLYLLPHGGCDSWKQPSWQQNVM